MEFKSWIGTWVNSGLPTVLKSRTAFYLSVNNHGSLGITGSQ